MNEIITTKLVLPLASGVGGFLLGWLARGLLDPKLREKRVESSFVLIVVTMIWALSMLVDVVNPQYTTNPLVHGLMGAIVGFFYKPVKKV